MTLHWWMHWFWITTLLILFGCNENTVAAPQSEELHVSTDTDAISTRHPERQGRAMYFTKATNIATTKLPSIHNVTEKNVTVKSIENNVKLTTTDTPIEIAHPAVTINKVNGTLNSTQPVINNNTNENFTTIVANTTEANLTPEELNVTKDVIKSDTSIEAPSESRIVTEKPLSLETSFLQTRIPANIESSRRIIDSTENGMDTGAIAGISFAALVLAALAGSTAFVLYRRRYLNKPQTLNDKCSNPDSSGYLDDSTIRDNSEEMYSLDNDSFLNSLEAMTIQNYWTDTVKHTKL